MNVTDRTVFIAGATSGIVLELARHPYFVSAKFLRSVSDFPADDTDSTNDQ